jgi:molybdate transport system substrate-binding protein
MLKRLLPLTIALLTSALPLKAEPLTIFAAASLKTALDEVHRVLPADIDGVRTSYAASSALARQVEAGAPADVFLSADLDWMDYLEQRSLIRPESRSTLLGNRLVLIATAGSPAIPLAAGYDLAGKLAGGRLAMGATESVPAGKYGKAALEKLGLWESVAGRVAGVENVRAALLLVSRGETPLGIVYATDAVADSKVGVVATFPADSHPPILYPVAIPSGSRNPAATAYLKLLRSEAARAIFTKNGFTPIE